MTTISRWALAPVGIYSTAANAVRLIKSIARQYISRIGAARR